MTKGASEGLLVHVPYWDYRRIRYLAPTAMFIWSSRYGAMMESGLKTKYIYIYIYIYVEI